MNETELVTTLGVMLMSMFPICVITYNLGYHRGKKDKVKEIEEKSKFLR